MGGPELFQRLLDYLLQVPAGTLYAIVGALAAIENVFPPVPADTAVALGAFASSAGRVSATTVFLVTWVSNMASAAGVYFFARRFGRAAFDGRLGRRLLDRDALDHLGRLYQAHGTWGIFLSRFVPGVRAIVPPFAGVVGLSPLRALVPTVLASGIWYGTLTFLIATFAGRIQNVVVFVDRLNAWVGAVAVGLGIMLGIGIWWRRRAGRRATDRET